MPFFSLRAFRPIRLPHLLLAPLLVLLVFTNCKSIERSLMQHFEAYPPRTVVFLVRHAEKDTTPGLADPPLTRAGEKRAQALRKWFKREPVSHILTSDTRRTRATVAPLAAEKQVAPQVYDPKNLPALARQIRALPVGSRVVVVGHSNTILETIEALGARRPVPEITDADYNYLFRLGLPENDTLTAMVYRYGAGRRK